MISRKEIFQIARAWMQAEEDAEAAKARTDEAKENEATARYDFSEAAHDYNYLLTDLQEMDDSPEEGDDPNNARFFSAELEDVKALADAAEAAETARSKWIDAAEERDIAAYDEEKAEAAATKEFMNFLKEIKEIINDIKEL